MLNLRSHSLKYKNVVSGVLEKNNVRSSPPLCTTAGGRAANGALLLVGHSAPSPSAPSRLCHLSALARLTSET